MYGHDFGLDAEIVELELDQPRHGFERFGRIAALFRRRLSSSDNAGSSFDCGGSNIGTCRSRSNRSVARGLTSIFSMTGSMRGAVVFGFDANLAYDLVALLLRAAAFPPDTRIAQPFVQRRDALIHDAAGAIHDRDPRNAGGELHCREPQHQQQNRRAEQSEPVLEAVTDDPAEDAAGRFTQIGAIGSAAWRDPSSSQWRAGNRYRAK